jgi:hypothetical protein
MIVSYSHEDGFVGEYQRHVLVAGHSTGPAVYRAMQKEYQISVLVAGHSKMQYLKSLLK